LAGNFTKNGVFTGRHITLRCSIRKFIVEGSNLCRMLMPIRDGLRCRMLMSLASEDPCLEIHMKWSCSVTRVNSTNVLNEGLRIGEIGRQMNSKVNSVKQGVYRK
jgi:hypothetical protein